ncbi:MAG: threonine ammonia-lyase [Candidatus Njordarchaeales archaeon]
MLTIIDAYRAKKRLSSFVRETPMYYSHVLSRRYETKVFLKLENYQVTGSFKVRGVFNKLLKHKDEARDKKILTVSTGNHAIAVAYASTILNVDSLIVVPRNITDLKRRRIEAIGGKIIFRGNNYDKAEKYARELATREGYLFLSPYNDIDIIEATTTIGLEILLHNPEIDTIMVPVGGGGLISGIAFLAKSINRDIRVYGVQSEASPAVYESLRKGKIVEVPLKPSIAEGLHGNLEKGSITFDFIRKYVDDVLLVSEEEIKIAIKELYETEGIIAEGAAAVTLAALKRYQELFRGRKVCLVISGGNIDPEHFLEAIRHE